MQESGSRLLCFCAFLWLLLFFLAVIAVGFFDAELFETVLQRAEGEAEELGGLSDVVVGLLHSLRYQVALDVFEINSFSRQLERAFRCWPNVLAYFGRQVFQCDQIAFAQRLFAGGYSSAQIVEALMPA